MRTCLAEDSLAEFVAGRLSAGRRSEAERHLDECRSCLAEVARVASGLAQQRTATLTPSASMELATGAASASRYRLQRKLGAGAMGEVYLADDRVLERKVALKVLRSDGGGAGALDAAIAALVLSGSQRARLLREAHAMARLSDRNVVAVHDVGLLDDDVFIVMEYVDGPTLREWLAMEPRSPNQILRVHADAGRGLVAAHAAGLIHRDFKPDNVLMAGDRALVSDFGLAERLDPEAEAASDAELGCGGTPAYMAPEQLDGGE